MLCKTRYWRSIHVNLIVITFKQLFAFIIFVGLLDEADYIHPCDLNGNDFEECLRKEMVANLKTFTLGIPKLGIPSIDPLNLEDIIIDGNGLKLTFTGAQLSGLSNAEITTLKVEIGQNDEKFKLGIITNVSLSAQYKADGKILILPIQGEGDALIRCQDIEVEINSKLSHIKGKKGDHFKLVTPNYKYDIKSTTFDLKNLFNGNKQLGDTTLQFANENWRQLMDDLAPPVIKQIVKTIVKTINKFFSKFTISRIVKGYKESS